MAGLGPGPGPAVPVWLTEDDLGCIICHGLLDWPATLACGHSFCRRCLEGMWGAGRRWACPTCRQGAAQKPRLQKNTLLQDLADKYSQAVRALDGRPDPAPDPGCGPAGGSPSHPAQLPLAAWKSSTEVGPELAELVVQLKDIITSLRSLRHLSESGPGNKPSLLGTLVTNDTFEGKMRDILRALEGVQEKLQEKFPWKEAPEEQTQVELLEAPSSSSSPLPNQSHPAPRRVSQFAQWAIIPTFDLESLSRSLEISKDGQTVTVVQFQQPYPWSRQRFSTCQVLCSQALSSGKKYWEVDTQYCSHWAVGVASCKMSRDQILGRTRDSWCVEWKGTSQLSAWHMEKETVLGFDRPGVVGIWLDLEAGKLAFYAVANQEKLLFECAVSTCCPLYPAFWLYGLSPGNSLSIKQVRA
ncbi:E3 ubiquitin-protein ligase RNF135 [Dasypus novemcinctus]|uniref:E3 ubiquitin-protein ligase RNF135 n=1 Tax=Dasypus novemcinctus TaxID=9361 RepID=UPI000328ACCA|nr:E3 ubiquitin-protein ligase RNF135 [Dasypus novemcinctus]